MFARIVIGIVVAMSVFGSAYAQSAEDTITVTRMNYANGAGFVRLSTGNAYRVTCAPNYEDAYPTVDTVVTLDNDTLFYTGDYGNMACALDSYTYEDGSTDNSMVTLTITMNANDSSNLLEYVADYVTTSTDDSITLTIPRGMMYSVLSYNCIASYSDNSSVYLPLIGN